MSLNTRQYIEDFYRGCRDSTHSKYLAVARDFMLRLYDERDLSGLTFFTSHEFFNLTREGKYPEWFDHPRIAICATQGGEVTIELIVPTIAPPVRRTRSESVICSPHLALDEFDKLFAKFAAR